MRKISNFCDYFVICNANSHRQVKAIADGIEEGLSKSDTGLRVKEGREDSGWVLLDYFDVVVHIFYGPLREFYSLERLWQDAPRIRARASVRKYVRKEGRRKTK
jgi:ribosome-associated protein